MKNWVAIFSLLLTLHIYGQKAHVKNMPEYDDKPIHFGYTMGLNVMDFSFDRNIDTLTADLASFSPGFQVGMISDYRLGEYFNLRIMPGFIFGQRNISYFYKQKAWSNGVLDTSMTEITPMKMESSMLDFPVLIKYKAKRINNFRPYLIAGGSIKYDLAAKSKFKEDQKEYILLKPFDVYTEMGFGIDFYLPYFKFSTEIKLENGYFNVLRNAKPNDVEKHVFKNALNGLKSNMVMIYLHFE